MIGKAPAHTAAVGVSLPNLTPMAALLRRYRLFLTLGLLAVIAAAFTGGLLRARGDVTYVSVPVTRQTLTQSVTASGTVNPQDTINVGTQASGTISEIDVHYNSRVRKGQVLARIDASQMQAQLSQAQANLAQAQAQAGAQSANAQGAQSGIAVAQAGIQSADANVGKAQSALQLANDTVTRDKALIGQGYISQSQYDADRAAASGAQSAYEAAQAAAAQARAQTSQSTAQAVGSAYSAQAQGAAVQAAAAVVTQDQYTMQHSVITSPVDGTVIARNVSVGQTVAASFQTPTLFTIAQDLKKMQVDINVGEPDIGNVRTGDAVTFSVLAYPNRAFHGVVSQIRVAPTTVNNVVTYDVVTLVNNASNTLLPGMTANATIAVKTAPNAVVVPLQALAFHPATSVKRERAGGLSSPWGRTASGAGGAAQNGARGRIYLQRGGKLVAMPVRVDLVSGTQAAVAPLRGALRTGDRVITGVGSSAAAPQHTASRPGPAMGIGRAFHG